MVGLQLYPRQGRGVVGYGTRALFAMLGFLLGKMGTKYNEEKVDINNRQIKYSWGN